MSAIWLLAAAFAVLLTAYVAARFLPRARGLMIGLALGLVGTTALLPGFDMKTVWALILGVALAVPAAAAGVRGKRPGARLALAYLALFLALAFGFPEWLADFSYFLLAASLVLPLLMIEVVRLGRDDRGREAALTRAASRPDRLTVASARGVELAPLAEILAVVGADDYVELRMAGGRSLLHAARLDGLTTQLPANFLRIHRSVIANLDHVQRLERDGDRWRLASEQAPLARQPLPPAGPARGPGCAARREERCRPRGLGGREGPTCARAARPEGDRAGPDSSSRAGWAGCSASGRRNPRTGRRWSRRPPSRR